MTKKIMLQVSMRFLSIWRPLSFPGQAKQADQQDSDQTVYEHRDQRGPLDHITRLAGIRKYPPEGGDERRGQGIHEGYESVAGVRPRRPQNESDQKDGFDEIGEIEDYPARIEHLSRPSADHHPFFHH